MTDTDTLIEIPTTTAPAFDPTTGEIVDAAPDAEAPAQAQADEDALRALLAFYGETKAALTVAEMDHTAREAEILRPVALALAAERARFAEQADALRAALTELETRIKAGTLALGRKVVGDGWQAVYTSGRTLWNDKELLRYAKKHPEIVVYRGHGKGSVSLRPAKDALAGQPALEGEEA